MRGYPSYITWRVVYLELEQPWIHVEGHKAKAVGKQLVRNEGCVVAKEAAFNCHCGDLLMLMVR